MKFNFKRALSLVLAVTMLLGGDHAAGRHVHAGRL